MANRLGKLVLIGMAAVVALAVAGIVWLAFGAVPVAKRPPAPVPNGYDTLLKAVALTPPMGALGPDHMKDREELEKLVASTQGSLALVHEALTQEFQAHLDPAAPDKYVEELSGFRRASRLLEAQGRLALLKGRPDEAIDSGLAQLLLGHKIPQGGAAVHAMVGMAIEKQGMALLEDVARATNHADFGRVARTLEQNESKRVSLAALWAGEYWWVKATHGFRADLVRLVNFKQMQQTKSSIEAKFRQHQVYTADTMLRFAARAYKSKHSANPSTAGDLVPEFLGAIPTDAMTGRPMSLPMDYD